MPLPMNYLLKGPRNAAMRAAARMRHHRRWLLTIALAVFIAGTAWSIERVGVTIAQVRFDHLLALLCILVPASILHAAICFIVMARATNMRVTVEHAFRVASIAQLAEFLPLPGGAIVRTGALVQLGTRTAHATSHVLAGAILWVACAAAAAGLSLGAATAAGQVLLIVGGAGVALCVAWLVNQAGWAIAIATLALRLIGLGLSGLRILTAFLAIGVSLALVDVYPFAFATIAGSASSLAPGGLGVGEALAMSISTLTLIDPGAAFLAVGINRIAGLIGSGIFTAFFFIIPSEKAQEIG